MSKKLRMTMKTAMTFEEGIAEFDLNCEARNLRSGTINPQLTKQFYGWHKYEMPNRQGDLNYKNI